MNGINFKAMEQTIQAIKEDPSLKMRNWQANIKWKSGVENTLNIRDFDPIKIDEPVVLGGTDLGPNPVELLIGTAASCFAITFQVLASQQGITLDEVNAHIEADLNAAVFLGLEEGDGGIIDPVITLTAKTSADQTDVEKIAETALGKSPVLLSMNATVNLKVE
ncbi:MAG TPA: OsmC family protein [Virgibacillus sp.]|nr:OsmC family protein [Virgibacillus sp.]